MLRPATFRLSVLIFNPCKSRPVQIMAAVFVLLLSSCASNGLLDTTRKKIGTAAGGVLGGAGGGVLGKKIGGTGGMITGMVVGAAAGAWVGNKIGAHLDRKDQEQLSASTQKTAITGKAQNYKNPETGVSIKTRVAKTETRQEKVSVPVLKDRVAQVPPLDFIGAPYSAKQSVNVRGGPGTDYKVVGRLSSGDITTAVGQVIGTNWYMISENGAASGFVSADYLTASENPAPAAQTPPPDETVETRQVETARICRTVEQIVVDSDGKEHTEELTACKGPNGWEIG